MFNHRLSSLRRIASTNYRTPFSSQQFAYLTGKKLEEEFNYKISKLYGQDNNVSFEGETDKGEFFHVAFSFDRTRIEFRVTTDHVEDARFVHKIDSYLNFEEFHRLAQKIWDRIELH